MFDSLRRSLFKQPPPQPPRQRIEPNFGVKTRSVAFNVGNNGGIGVSGSLAQDLSTLFPASASYGGLSQSGRTRFDLYQLRNASRLITREHSMGSRFLQLMKRNIVTRDVQPPRFDGELDQKLADMVSKAWIDWWGSDQVFLDSRSTGVSVERQILGSVIEDGDALVQIMMVGGELKLRHFTGDQFYEAGVSADHSTAQYMGIVLDKDNRPQAYLIHDNIEQSDANYLNPRSGKALAIPADDCIHIFDPASAKQYRGIPWSTPVLTRIAAVKNFDTYSSATMQLLSKVAGVMTRSPEAPGHYGGGLRGGRDDIVNDESAPTLEGIADQNVSTPENHKLQLSPNTILDLPPGMDLKFPSPDVPTDTIQNYRDELMHEICTGFGIDYATFMGDYAKTNFAGARQGVINNREMFKDFQIWWAQDFRIKVFKRWLAIYEGRFFPNLTKMQRDLVNKPTFTGPRWDWVDPKKDIEALILAYDRGLISPQDIARQKGMKLDTVYKEIAAAKEMAKANGIELDIKKKSENNGVTLGADDKESKKKDSDDD